MGDKPRIVSPPFKGIRMGIFTVTSSARKRGNPVVGSIRSLSMCTRVTRVVLAIVKIRRVLLHVHLLVVAVHFAVHVEANAPVHARLKPPCYGDAAFHLHHSGEARLHARVGMKHAAQLDVDGGLHHLEKNCVFPDIVARQMKDMHPF